MPFCGTLCVVVPGAGIKNPGFSYLLKFSPCCQQHMAILSAGWRKEIPPKMRSGRKEGGKCGRDGEGRNAAISRNKMSSNDTEAEERRGGWGGGWRGGEPRHSCGMLGLYNSGRGGGDVWLFLIFFPSSLITPALGSHTHSPFLSHAHGHTRTHTQPFQHPVLSDLFTGPELGQRLGTKNSLLRPPTGLS